MMARTLTIPTARVFTPLLQPARDKVARGGRGSGKSHFFAGGLVEDSLAEPGDNGGEGLRSVCIRQVQKDLAQSAKLLIESKLSEHRLGEADGFKVFNDCIRTPGDGLVIFKGMNHYNSDSVKSLEGFKRAWWEEAHTALKTSIDLLRPTMRAAGSQMWWSYNRRRRSDPVDAMFTGEEKPTGAVIVEANWRDNPWFTAELEQERLDCLRLWPDQYDHIWEGDYAQVTAGAYYAAALAEARREGRVGLVAADPLMQRYAIFDIGFADATAIWIVQFVGTELRFIDYYEAVGQPLSAHLEWLRMNGHGSAQIILPHDGSHANVVTGTRFEDHVRAAGFEVRVIPNQGRGAAMRRVEAARRVFPACRFDEAKCTPGLEALGAYHERKDDKRGIGLGPEHDWASHGADAFGLACTLFESLREPARSVAVVRAPRVAGAGAWMGGMG